MTKLKDRLSRLSGIDVFIWCLILLSLILFSVSYGIEKWSVSDGEKFGLSQFCFDQGDSECCQRFEDRGLNEPDWVRHVKNSLIAAWVFIILTLITWCFGEFARESGEDCRKCCLWIFFILCFTTVLCLIIAVGLFSDYYKTIPGFEGSSRHASFGLLVVCIMIYLLVCLVVIGAECCDGNILKNGDDRRERSIQPSLTYNSRRSVSSINTSPNNVWTTDAQNNGSTSSVEQSIGNILKNGDDRRERSIQPSPTYNSRRSVSSINTSPNNVWTTDAQNNGSTSSVEQSIALPRVTAREIIYEVKHGDSVVLECTVDSNTIIESVYWKKLGRNGLRRIDIFNHKYSSVITPNLIIKRVTTAESGTYQCYANNYYGIGESQLITVKVLYEPKVTHVKDCYIGTIGSRLDLECRIVSDPPEKRVYWKKNVGGTMRTIDKTLPGYSMYQQSRSNPAKLRILNVDRSHIGYYQCFAVNDIGTGFSSYISVRVQNSTIDIPLHWSRMEKFENLKIVELQFGDQEYNEIVNEFKANMGPNYNIIAKVERIQNLQLYRQYLAEKEGMISNNPTGQINERKLWHGTNHQVVDSINMKGFDRSFRGTNGVLYGQGCYFSSSPSYSAKYALSDSHGYKRMYFCKVLIGEFTKGDKNMNVPPPISEGSHIRYNSLVDDTLSPKIFVVFRDAQAYPDYLITFK